MPRAIRESERTETRIPAASPELDTSTRPTRGLLARHKAELTERAKLSRELLVHSTSRDHDGMKENAPIKS